MIYKERGIRWKPGRWRWAPSGNSPYVTQHINRFGRYDLDMEKRPPELVYDLWM